MEIWQVDKLTLFLVFFVPGFISIKVYDLLVPGEPRDFSKALFDAVAYSALNFAALLPPILLVNSTGLFLKHRWLYWLSAFLILFAAPVIWPFGFFKLSTWRPLAKRFVHPIRKPWDYVFGKRLSYWVMVHLRDGRRIGGRFGTESFASSSPAEHQIYVEEVWQLDEQGAFLKPVERSKGMIVLEKDIIAVEFFG